MSKEKELPRGVPEAQTPIPGGTDAQGPPPKFGTEKPAESDGKVPRVLDALERSPRKNHAPYRFKISCKNYHPQSSLYILANTEDDARALYVKATELDKQLVRLKKNGGVAEEPDLAVTQLED